MIFLFLQIWVFLHFLFSPRSFIYQDGCKSFHNFVEDRGTNNNNKNSYRIRIKGHWHCSGITSSDPAVMPTYLQSTKLCWKTTFVNSVHLLIELKWISLKKRASETKEVLLLNLPMYTNAIIFCALKILA